MLHIQYYINKMSKFDKLRVYLSKKDSTKLSNIIAGR